MVTQVILLLSKTRGGQTVKLEITDKQIRSRLMKQIRALRYPNEFDLVKDIAGKFERKIEDKEQRIIKTLVARKKLGLGLGHGPGAGGDGCFIMIDQITPEFVRGVIKQQGEGRSFYHWMPQCGGDDLHGEAASLFTVAWNKAVDEGLKQRLFFRDRHRYYTDEALYMQAKHGVIPDAGLSTR